MIPIRVVIDTNILYAALYSANGASHHLIRMVRSGRVRPCLSVTLAMEYEAVLMTKHDELQLILEEVSGFLGYLVSLAERIRIFYLWRPGLRDPGDDMILETAVAARAEYIITHNIRDFNGANRFGIQVVTPGWFIRNFGGTP
jgi:putative PIN family toxin of toxin-antitoxin system